jgi:hypothetical protein
MRKIECYKKNIVIGFNLLKKFIFTFLKNIIKNVNVESSGGFHKFYMKKI